MKALVTGAGGFIGAHVARLLVERGDTVRFCLAPGERESAEGAALPGERMVADVRDLPAVRRAVDGVDAVFHLAALYELYSPDPRRLYAVNVHGTANVLRAARDAGVLRVVHTSSIAAVGIREDGRPSTEEDAFNQHDKAVHYALSKHEAELVAREAAAEGQDVVIVNPGFPFGPGDRRPTPTGRVIVRVLNRTYFGYGPGGISAVAVEDVARGHLLAHDHGRRGRRYLLTGHDVTWGDFYAAIHRAAGIERAPLRLPKAVLWAMGRVGDLVAPFAEPLVDSRTVRYAAQHFCYDASRARSELGFSNAPLEETVQRAVDWFRAEGYA